MSEDWKPHGKSITGSDDTVYALDEQDASERIKLTDRAWLLVRKSSEVMLNFAVFEFAYSNTDDSDARYTLLLSGSGAAGELRECRHIWWGDEGYTHGLDFEVVEAALRELRRWFDGR